MLEALGEVFSVNFEKYCLIQAQILITGEILEVIIFLSNYLGNWTGPKGDALCRTWPIPKL